MAKYCLKVSLFRFKNYIIKIVFRECSLVRPSEVNKILDSKKTINCLEI